MPSTATSRAALHMDPKELLSKQFVLALLLLFSFFYLPRSTAYFSGHDPSGPHPRHVQKQSADRPEHPFLTPITSDPLSSSLWQLSGVAFSMMWWGDWLRDKWQSEISAKKGDGSRVRDETELVAAVQGRMSQKLAVSHGLAKAPCSLD
jgi:phosphatidylinositol glycan class F